MKSNLGLFFYIRNAYFLILGVLILLLSCQKEQRSIEAVSEITGDYEWSHSDVVPPEENYGIRITDKGDLITFINGKEKEKYKIWTCFHTHEKAYEFRTKGKIYPPLSGNITIYNDGTTEMTLSNFPENSNYFFAHE